MFTEVFFLENSVEKLAPCAKLTHYVKISFILVVFKNLDYTRMILKTLQTLKEIFNNLSEDFHFLD